MHKQPRFDHEANMIGETQNHTHCYGHSWVHWLHKVWWGWELSVNQASYYVSQNLKILALPLSRSKVLHGDAAAALRRRSDARALLVADPVAVRRIIAVVGEAGHYMVIHNYSYRQHRRNLNDNPYTNDTSAVLIPRAAMLWKYVSIMSALWFRNHVYEMLEWVDTSGCSEAWF